MSGELIQNGNIVGTLIRNGVIFSNRPRMKETTLWTNPSPSADFANQTITLSDNMNNYTYLKVRYKLAKASTDTDYRDIVVSVSDFKNMSGTNSSFAIGLNTYGTSSGTLYGWSRSCYPASDTTIYFTGATTINTSITQNQRIIPLSVIGIKEEPRDSAEDTLWTNAAPTSNFAQQSLTLSASMMNYDRLKIIYRSSTTNPAQHIVEIDVETFETGDNGRYILGTSITGVGNFVRLFQKADNMTITIADGRAMGGTTTGQNNVIIPVQILGIRDGARKKYATGYFTANNTSVDLGFVPKYVFCANGTATSSDQRSHAIIYDSNVSKTQFKFLTANIEEMRNIGTIGSANQFCMEGTVIGMNPSTDFSFMKNSHRQYVAIGYGTEMVETTLWTNSSPTTARSGTNTITLSQPYDTFDLVKIKVAYATAQQDNIKSLYLTPDDLANSGGAYTIPISLAKINSSLTYVAVRHLTSSSNTTITDVCDASNQSDSDIILEVAGIKIQ